MENKTNFKEELREAKKVTQELEDKIAQQEIKKLEKALATIRMYLDDVKLPLSEANILIQQWNVLAYYIDDTLSIKLK